ncbi:hypothetical protein PV08_02877 [Exophiala spinifera]|uniref:Ima1 N-terminal domain-containing protein n=1 Tax=Exophiala spinifera TaxID=91928 RepID=A0A0D2C4T2_9EURO|nr:uncharacterized protein PV08_02877 [Exophiala spinifera]KIW18589.1 hypothetical protein PV08_02877 [Exophiala spinifera]
MPVSLRQRLDCHYCGRRSKLSKKDGRKFQCEHCLAVNFFDENGEIADVPVEELEPAQRFAQPVRVDPLNDGPSSADLIFCSTCLKNQQFYTYHLAQFLPDPDHPDYEKLEAELPAYKKGLEERYPQCCPRCEPKVRAKLHQATYHARSDHLRRVLEKSRQRRIGSRLGWRSLLVSAAGVGYFLSFVVQLGWHLYGSQIVGKSSEQVLSPRECYQLRVYSSQCLDALEPFVGLSLAVSLLCIWWNPKWQHKLSNHDGSLSGLYEYYLIQMALLGLRFIAWIVMFHVPLDIRFSAILHACFAVGIAIIAGWSFLGIVKTKSLPPVNWQDDPAPLLSQNQFVPPELPEEAIQAGQSQPFNLENLSPAQNSTYQAWRPPTPPEDAGDSMDWSPTQQIFRPELKNIRYQPTSPSPFYGKLPALDARGLRPTVGQKEPETREAIGIPPGFFDRPARSAIPRRQQGSPGETMAPPKFFPKEADTGLENIFGSVFSLKDQSIDSPTKSSQGPSTAVTRTDSTPGFTAPTQRASLCAIFSSLSFFAILMSVAVWMFEAAIVTESSRFGYYVVLSSTFVPIGHLSLHLAEHGVQGQFLRLLAYALEASFLIGVSMLREPFGQLLRDLWTKLAIASVALLLPQEFLQMNNSTNDNESTLSYRAPSHLTQGAPRSTNQQDAFPRRPLLDRKDSTESIESKASVATSSTMPEWTPPRSSRQRFDVPGLGGSTPRPNKSQPRHSGTAQSERSNLGIDGLSLTDRPPVTGRGGSSRGWDFRSTGSSIAGPRTGRGY